MDFIFIAVPFVIFAPIILYMILKPIFRQRRISNGVINYNAFYQDYLFKVNYTKSDFLQRMNVPNSYDVLEYTFDDNSMIITFSKLGANIPYTVFIKEIANGCYVRLSRNVLVGNRSDICIYINEFMMKKFGAELLPYEEYKDIII